MAKATNSATEKELEKVQEQSDKFNNEIKEMSLDRMNAAPKQELEPQTKLAQSDIEKSKDVYLKPVRAIGSKEKFNEKFRDDYSFQKEYVRFIAENKEIIGETIDIWTKPFPGLPAEEWKVPVNTPVWGPRYLAEQITKCKYHRFVMQDNRVQDGLGTFTHSMAVDTTIQRLDAIPVSTRKSIFMAAGGF